MNSIVLFDIDDTILKSKVEDIGIWKFKDGEKERLSTEEFANDSDKGKPGITYDYWEFNDPDIVRRSIMNGTPLLSNLKIIDNYINKGYDCAFLTARGCEDVIKDAMMSFLKFRDKDGRLQDIKNNFKKSLSYAVGDEKYCEVLDGLKDFERKAKIIKMIADMYDNVVFIDDDDKNLKAARNLNLSNVEVIDAK